MGDLGHRHLEAHLPGRGLADASKRRLRQCGEGERQRKQGPKTKKIDPHRSSGAPVVGGARFPVSRLDEPSAIVP
ncbi:hypothetical protein GCM10008026_22150 [Chelatococcus composti]|nr:hypothetical protein GCM10008026_22150 [Chelatococcus composti]